MTPARCLQNTPDQINSSNSTIRRSIRWYRRPSRKRCPCELRAGAVNARRPRRRRGRSAAKNIEGAEHSSRIERVMAGGSFPPTSGNVCATNSGTFRGAISGRCGDAIAMPIHVEREAGSRDVSDPVEWPWGQLRGSGGGRSRPGCGTILSSAGGRKRRPSCPRSGQPWSCNVRWHVVLAPG
jgi:hypothetical protein